MPTWPLTYLLLQAWLSKVPTLRAALKMLTSSGFTIRWKWTSPPNTQTGTVWGIQQLPCAGGRPLSKEGTGMYWTTLISGSRHGPDIYLDLASPLIWSLSRKTQKNTHFFLLIYSLYAKSKLGLDLWCLCRSIQFGEKEFTKVSGQIKAEFIIQDSEKGKKRQETREMFW